MKSYYYQNSFGIFLIILLLVNTADIKNDNITKNIDPSKLSFKEVNNLISLATRN